MYLCVVYMHKCMFVLCVCMYVCMHSCFLACVHVFKCVLPTPTKYFPKYRMSVKSFSDFDFLLLRVAFSYTYKSRTKCKTN
jgi:hypothetical protein